MIIKEWQIMRRKETGDAMITLMGDEGFLIAELPSETFVKFSHAVTAAYFRIGTGETKCDTQNPDPAASK